MKSFKKILLIIFTTILFLISLLNHYNYSSFNIITRNVTLTKDNKIDIVFSTDDGIIYLSKLKDNETINKVGWFYSLFKTIA